MPKITIKESDNTKVKAQEYRNFTIVVPGAVGAAYNTEVFNDDDVYECSSQADFVSNVNLVAAGSDVAIGPTVESKLAMGEDAFKAARANKTLYNRAEDTSATSEGYLVGKDETDGKYYKYSLVEDSESYDATKTYYLIAVGFEGCDALSFAPHYGNQIAYYLLGLGYTVLYKKLYVQGGSSVIQAGIKQLVEDTFWSCFEDKGLYDFRYIVSGAMSYTADSTDECLSKVNEKISALATKRGDCIALLDIDKNAYNKTTVKTQAQIIAAIKTEANKHSSADEYSALFAPVVTYNMEPASAFQGNATFPASFHYLTCAANAFKNYNEWYAVAGYTRGLSPYSILSAKALGETAIDALEPRVLDSDDGALTRAINLIAKIKGNFFLWGNRTARLLQKDGLIASHFLNIRQLCTTIKKQLYVACRQFTFDPNSDVLWINFCNAIIPTLEAMKADQGISAYKLIQEEVEGERAVLKATIRIVPIEAVEDFTLTLTLEDEISGNVEIEEA